MASIFGKFPDGSLVMQLAHPCTQCDYPWAELVLPCALCGVRACETCSEKMQWRAQLHLLQRGRRRNVREGPLPGWSVWRPVRWGHILRGRPCNVARREKVWVCGSATCRRQFRQVQMNLIVCGIEVNCW